MSRPPRLPDTAILELIAELRAEHPVLTGTRLREELTRRYGSPCGVARVYRLLRAARAAPPTAAPGHLAIAPDSVNAGDLHEQLRQALERAALAEHREEHHQARWAGEIHALREQLRDVANSGQRMHWLEDEVRNKARELASAFLRIADLEAQLEHLGSG